MGARTLISLDFTWEARSNWFHITHLSLFGANSSTDVSHVLLGGKRYFHELWGVLAGICFPPYTMVLPWDRFKLSGHMWASILYALIHRSQFSSLGIVVKPGQVVTAGGGGEYVLLLLPLFVSSLLFIFN